MKSGQNEKTLGILGLAPYATCDFYKKVLKATHAKKDWEHIRIVINNDPKIPSRGRCIELGETDPSPHIREGIIKLKDWGADFAIIPCNTAHYFYESMTENVGIPVLHMIEETARYVLQKQLGLKTVGLLASSITVDSKLYDKYLSSGEVNVITVKEEQAHVRDIIEKVKQGDDSNQTKSEIKEIALKLIGMGADAVIVGCTEISMVLKNGDVSVPVYDSNEILAEIAVEKAKKY